MPECPPNDDASDREWDVYFRLHGEPKLRMLIAGGGWPQHLMLKTVNWLAKQDRLIEARREAAQLEQIEIARSSQEAAWVSARAAQQSACAAEKANGRASLALLITVISVLATVVGLVVSHLDAVRSN